MTGSELHEQLRLVERISKPGGVDGKGKDHCTRLQRINEIIRKVLKEEWPNSPVQFGD